MSESMEKLKLAEKLVGRGKVSRRQFVQLALAAGFGACKAARPGSSASNVPASVGSGTPPERSAGAGAPAALVGHWRSETEQLDIQPNGNLVVEAHQNIRINEEVWQQSLTGVVRRT